MHRYTIHIFKPTQTLQMLLKRRMYGLCFERQRRRTQHCLPVFWLWLLAAASPKALGYFLGDTKAVLNGCEDHWTLQDRTVMPLLFQMTVCVDIRVVVPGAWVAFSYSSIHAPRPELGLEGDDEALYGWLLRVRHRFPVRLSPKHWHRVCLRRDVTHDSFSLEVDGKAVAERTVISRAIPPSGSLWLGCRPRDRPPGAVLGVVELYLFRMWADLGDHGFCEDGTVIGWNARYWGLTSPKARQTDPKLLCATNTRDGRDLTTLPEVNCDISQLCSNENVYFWMLVSGEAKQGRKTEQVVQNWVLHCNDKSNLAAHGIKKIKDFCQDDRQLEVVHVNCEKKRNTRETCDVLVQLRHAVSASKQQHAGDDRRQWKIIGEVERVAPCGDMEASSGGFLGCLSTSSLDDICERNKCSKRTCEPNKKLAVLVVENCPSTTAQNRPQPSTPSDSDIKLTADASLTDITEIPHTTAETTAAVQQMDASKGTAQPNTTTPLTTINNTQSSTARPALQTRSPNMSMTLSDSRAVENTSLSGNTTLSSINSTLQITTTALIDSTHTTITLPPNHTTVYSMTTADNNKDLNNDTVTASNTTISTYTTSPKLKAEYNVTTADNQRNLYDTTLNATKNTFLPSPNRSVMYNVTTRTSSYTEPSNNYTIANHVTTVSSYGEQHNSTTTTSKTTVSLFTSFLNHNVTTAMKNYTTILSIYTTKHKGTATENNRDQQNYTATNNIIISAVTAFPNYTIINNVTSATNKKTTAFNNDTTENNITPEDNNGTHTTSSISRNTTSSSLTSSPNHTVAYMTTATNNNTTAFNNDTTENSVTTVFNNGTHYNTSISRNTTSSSLTSSPNHTVVYMTTATNNNTTAFTTDITENNITTVDNNGTHTTSSFSRNTKSNSTPSPNHTLAYMTTATNNNTTAFNIDTTENSVTTVDNNQTHYKSSLSSITTSRLIPPSPNHTLAYMTTTTNKNTRAFKNNTTEDSVTTVDRNRTHFNDSFSRDTTNSLVTPSPNHTVAYMTTATNNNTTAFNNDTTENGVTTVDGNRTHYNTSISRNTTSSSLALSPNPTVVYMTTATNNNTTAFKTDITENSFTTRDNNGTHSASSFSRSTTSSSTPFPSHTLAYFNNDTTANGVTMVFNNGTHSESSLSSITTSSSIPPSPNHTVAYMTTATNNNTTAFNNDTTEKNITTVDNYRSSFSRNTTSGSLTPSPNHTVVYMTTATDNNTTSFNNDTTENNITTMDNNTTHFESSIARNTTSSSLTSSPNHTVVYMNTATNDNTTAFNNDTTENSVTMADSNSTIKETNSTVSKFTFSPNYTMVNNVTTSSNYYKTVDNVTTVSLSPNRTPTDNATTSPLRETQQNTTISTTAGQVESLNNATTSTKNSSGNNMTSVVDNTTEATVAPLNNQTGNDTTEAATHNITATSKNDTNTTTAATGVSPSIYPNQAAGISSNQSTSANNFLAYSDLTQTIAGTTQTTSAETTSSHEAQVEQALELLDQTKNVSQLSSSQMVELTAQLEKLLVGPTVSQAVGQKAVNMISNLMEGDLQALSACANRLIRLVDDLGLKLVVAGDKEFISSNSLILAVWTVDGTNFSTTFVDIFDTNDVQLGALRRSKSERSGSALGSVFLPWSLTAGLSPEQQQQASRLQFTYYTKSSLFQDSGLDNKTIVSPVLASSVANLSIGNLSEHIQFTIRNPIHGNYSVSCAFWDFNMNNGEGGWSKAGCFLVNSTAEDTTCSCNHLTSFAILLDLSRDGLTDRKQAQILTFITYIGCGISAIFLAVTLLTYLLFQKLLRDIPAKILVQFCMSLLLLNLVFMLDGWLALYPVTGLCISTAFFLHYFLLTSFTWAGLEALHMYLSVIKVFTPYLSRYMLRFSLMGWGLPLVVVIIVISVDKDNYGLVAYGKYANGSSDDFCWLRNDIAFYLGVVAYFLLIFILCLLVFIMVMVQLARIKKQNPHNQSPNRGLMTDMRSITGIIILLGLTWGCALFAWGPLSLPFTYLFSIFNSLQGFLVFVFHCAVKENVRRQWKTYLCCGRLRLAENSEWSRMATQNNKNMSVTMANASAPPFTSRSSSVISDGTNSSGSVFADSGISDGFSSDVVLNEIHRQNMSVKTAPSIHL